MNALPSFSNKKKSRLLLSLMVAVSSQSIKNDEKILTNIAEDLTTSPPT